MDKNTPAILRGKFAAMTSAPDENGCWRWGGTIRADGYPVSHPHFGGKRWIVTRLAWFLAFGDIPDGKDVCHRCDVRCCVNPSHLFLGDHQDNMTDMVKKNRQACGERAGRAKTTAAMVADIRRARAAGLTPKQISETLRLPIARCTISHIGIGRTWKSEPMVPAPKDVETVA